MKLFFTFPYLSKETISLMKGLAILSIAMHNLLHLKIFGFVTENETNFNLEYFNLFFNHLTHFHYNAIGDIISFLGWLGVPVFIFISGYFSRKKKKAELPASIWKLLEPLIIFQALTLLPRFIMKGFSFGAILTPWYVLWYLLSLIYWRLLIQIIPDRILNNTKLILIVAFCISILAGFLPFGRFLSIQRTLSFMPFFFLGYYMRGKNIYLPKKYKPLSFLFLISVTASALSQAANIKWAQPMKAKVQHIWTAATSFLRQRQVQGFLIKLIHRSWLCKQV